VNDFKTTSGALVKHNGLMLAQSIGTALTVFDLQCSFYQATRKVTVVVKDKLWVSLALDELDSYELQEDAYYDFGDCSSLEEFFERSIPVGRMINAAKEILYYATRKGSKVVLMVDREDDGFSNVLSQCCKYKGIYLSDLELECRTGSRGVGSCDKFRRLLVGYLRNSDYQSVRLFSDNRKNLKAFLDLRSDFCEILFEGYSVGAAGSLSVMM